jgi:nitrogen fixation NifU-like protein
MIEKIKEYYSETFIDHSMNPRNMGRIPDADGFASITDTCGDAITIWLKVKNEKLKDVSFMTNGCGAAIACCSVATELVKGRSVSQAISVNENDIFRILGDLPEDNRHLPLLVANTVKKALQDYLALKKEPWKKAYRR